VPEDITTLDISGAQYDLSGASSTVVDHVTKLRELDQVMRFKKNKVAVMEQAKRAYLSELKAEILQKKSGLDLGSLFGGE